MIDYKYFVCRTSRIDKKVVAWAMMAISCCIVSSNIHAGNNLLAGKQDSGVLLQWDSQFDVNDVSADKQTLSAINSILASTRDAHFTEKLFGLTKLIDGKYAVLSKTKLNHVNLPSDLSERNRLIQQTGTYLYVVDLADDKDEIDFTKEIKGYVGPALYGSDYGCMQDRIPIFRGDLNKDGKPEIFYFSSHPNGLNFAASDSVDLHILSGVSYKEIFSTRLLEDEVSSETPSSGHESKHYTEYGLGSDGFTDFNKPGMRSFTKLFFGDLQKNNHKEILVWNRNYEATKGWRFESESFELYEMSAELHFTMTKLTSEQGHAILKADNLSWKQGFPNKNFCNQQGKPTDKSLISNIYDPVLKD